MHQNDVPLVRQIRITNNGPAAVENLHVRLTSEPEIFPAWETSVAAVPPSGTYSLGPIDLRLSANLLMGLTERVSASIRAEIRIDNEIVGSRVRPIAMLAFDEWNGLAYSMPELLAAFVLPNHSCVELILSDAAQWLGEKTGDRSLSGYQAHNATRVGQTLQAIFAAVQARSLSYCNPPASFEKTGQKIRLPDRIFEHKLATCLDLAVLVAACVEQAGLNPLVVMKDGHAFAAAWLVEDCFPDPGTDDLLRLRKRVDLNEILVFETTLTTAPPPNDFATAVAAGKRHLLDEEHFGCAIDIARCRKSGIRPLPARGPTGTLVESETAAEVNLGGTIFDLPAKAGPKAERTPETPATRLDRWKRKLLDLSLHNRLINFKESKKTVRLLCPDLSTLEDALADGLEFKILPRPAEFGPDAARSTALHHVRTGADALNQLLKSELDSRRLRSDMTDHELQQRLTAIFRTARTAVEEGGASALYLALGFLAWYEAESAQQRRVAPIILIPVELRRNSIQEGFRFCQCDEEPRLNITLLEMLTKDFELHVPNMDPIPEDEHGIDVAGILTAFRQAIKNTNRWDVLEEAQLGLFSFAKFLMWRDLEKRAEDLLESKVVHHLVNHANEPFPDDGVFPSEERLDEQYAPSQTFCPLPSDSSQLAAVYAAATPKSFVMFGPPGTGKSQTITNLIAHTLANNKTVLFVSEKLAALNVVHHRISQCGLGPFCLELHSNKSNKRHVVDQIGRALDFRASRPSDDWEREANRLAALRTELNAYVRALHQPRSFGESAFQGLSRLIGLRDARPIDLKLADFDAISREHVEHWRELIQQMRIAGEACGHPGSSAWSGSGVESWLPATQRAIESDIDRLRELCDQLASHAQKLGPLLGLGTTWNLSYFDFAEKLVRFLATSPRPTAALLTEADWGATEASIKEWLRRGRKRDELRQTLYRRYDHSVLKLDLADLADRATKARATWFLPRWFATRAIRKLLGTNARQPTKLGLDALSGDIVSAQALRDEEKTLIDAGERARPLLGQYWRDGEADWNAIENVLDWSGEFRKYAQMAAGGNLDKAAALRRHWTRLVTEGHESLQPNGVLGSSFACYLDSLAEFAKTKARLESLLSGGEALWGSQGRRATPSDIALRLVAWKSDLNGLRSWCNWRRVRREAEQVGLLPLVHAYEVEGLASTALRDSFDRSFYQWWTEAVIEREPVLRKFFSPEHERKIQQFRELDERYAELTKSEIQARLAARRPVEADRVNQNSEIGILNRQRQLRRGHMPVRRLFQKIPHLLHQLKPCVLMSPISVAQYLDAAHPPFDLVVFDEASQVPVWDAVGAIARGAEAVIAGDPKQLPPTTFFMRGEEDGLVDEALADVQDMESILDDCMAARLPTMPLRWHYRSRHESLIAFSNHFYYDNELLTFPSPFVGKGVSYRWVQGGVYDRSQSRTNRAEAEAIVAEVVGRMRDPRQSGHSIGVVTFSIAQQGLVEDLLDDARRAHPEIEPFFSDDVAEPVFVKNLENVQGDERDVILMSVCYGPDAEGRVSMNFGPLNREGGERRLNVAITRARLEVQVFATLKADQIDLSRTRARGAQDLKCFLDYAERGPIAIAQALTLRGGADFESPFEKAVCQKLRERGHEVHSQVRLLR
ncbi:MAG: DNA helicase [Methyloceanibacter sp.]|nr:MAG: DNA helicase [Methyloceanibacter sp.]